MSTPDPHNTSGSHRVSGGHDHDHGARRGAVGETSERVGRASTSNPLKWILPLLIALVALTLFFFAGDNDRDNFPDTVDQIGNDQPGNCGANQTAQDEGTGDIAPDDQNDCESLAA
jgi:hypothetical protein